MTHCGRLRRAAARYRRQLERGDAVGRITVPRLDLNAIVVEGTDSATLTKGPGRYTKSYVPGEGELIYIAGHRTTYGAPLAHIDRMRRAIGSRSTCPTARSSTASRAASSCPRTTSHGFESAGREEIALQACHPRFFASQRYIVYAKPVSITPRGGSTVRSTSLEPKELDGRARGKRPVSATNERERVRSGSAGDHVALLPLDGLERYPGS